MKHTDQEYIETRTFLYKYLTSLLLCNFLININFSTKISTKPSYITSDMTCRNLQESAETNIVSYHLKK